MKKSRTLEIDRQKWNMGVAICISFLIAVFVGAVVSNVISSEKVAIMGEELKTFFSGIFENGEEIRPSFSAIFMKYAKYVFLIWLGGWFPFGIILSGGILMFRGASLGFTAAMLMKEFGMRGVIATVFTILPQNLLLIPTYLFITWAAISFSIDRGTKKIGKAGLKRERTKKSTEYAIFFSGAVICLALVSLLEISVLPYFMKIAAVILK
jgi:stage II sporulation protein M